MPNSLEDAELTGKVPALLIMPVVVNLALAPPVLMYLVSASGEVYHDSVPPLLRSSMVVKRLDVPVTFVDVIKSRP